MLMTTHLFFQQPRSDLKGLLLWLYLLCSATPSATLAATLHAIIVADTNGLKSSIKDRDNIQQLVANVKEATSLKLNQIVIDGNSGFGPRSGYETVTKAITELQVTAKEDVVMFYYAGHGVNTETGSQWPAMEVEGENTARDKLIELKWVEETLSAKSPRLLIAIADACNLSEPSRGEGAIWGEGVGPYKQAYIKLFLDYQGVIMASASTRGQAAFHDNSGGRFTQQFLTSLKEELAVADPNWDRIRERSVKDIPVNSPVDAKDQPMQTPQMTVEPPMTAVGKVDGGNGIVMLGQPQVLCPQPTSGGGACYLNTAAEGGKKWSAFVEVKSWLTTWQGWEQAQPGSVKGDDIASFYRPGGNHFISVSTDPTLVHIITPGIRYDKFSLGVSVLPKQSYSFSEFTRNIKWWQVNSDGTPSNFKDSLEQVTASAEREELDITTGYSILPELQVGIGFKRARLNYQYRHYSDNPFFEEPRPNEIWFSKEEYKTYGLSLNIGGEICLANLSGTNVSLFGNFSYGALKTTWRENESNYTTYHSTDLGLSWELWRLNLPEKLGSIEIGGQLKVDLRFGYRAQTLYTLVSRGDAVDTTEGFTLGLRVTY